MSCIDNVFKNYEEIPSAEFELIRIKLGLDEKGLYFLDQDELDWIKIDRIEIGVSLIFSIVNQTWNYFRL